MGTKLNEEWRENQAACERKIAKREGLSPLVFLQIRFKINIRHPHIAIRSGM